MKNNKRSAVSLCLAILLFFTGIPFTPLQQTDVAQAETLLNIDPQTFSNVYGGKAEIKFRYEDESHETEVKVTDPVSYMIETGKTYNEGIEHTVTWDGKKGDTLFPENTYTIKAGPVSSDKNHIYAKQGTVTIFNESPPAPTIEILANKDSDSHMIRGIAEKGTKVTLTIQYEVRKNGTQTIDPSLTKVYKDIATTKGQTWSRDQNITDYFGSRISDNRPKDYIGEWEKEVTLEPYAIAYITAKVTRIFDGKTAEAKAKKVLRYKVPDDERRWAMIASYYYGLQNTKEEIESKLAEITSFNGFPKEKCVDGNSCYGKAFAGQNVLLEDPINAGIIYKDIASRIEDEYANKNGHPLAEDFDPINLATGDFGFYHTNMSLQAKMPLEFAVSYHSKNKYNGDLGVGWNHSFDYRVTKMKDGHVYVKTPRGASLTYIPTEKGEFLTPPGVFNTLKQHKDGTYTMETPEKWQYVFRQDGELYKIIDANGNVTTLQYFGSLLEKVWTDGASMSFTYGTAGKITKVTDHTGRTVQYDYDPLTHDLNQITLPDGATIRFEYDEKHRLTKIHNPKQSAALINEYDDQDRVVKQRDFSGEWGTIDYQPEENKTVITDQRGYQTFYQYDQRFRKTAVYYPDKTAEKFEYDGNDQLTSYTDRNGNVSEFIYDGLGNLLQKVDPLGNITTITYNGFSKPTTVVDPLGNKTTISYDDKGNMVSLENPLGETTLINRNDQGVPTSIVNPVGETVKLENDQFGFVAFIVDPMGNKQKLVRDPLHRVTSIVNALGNTTEIEYDPRDRIVSKINALGHKESFQYDKNSNLVKYIDPAGALTEYQYDSFDRLIVSKDALGNATRSEYDKAGNLIKRIEPNGAVTTYQYNSVNRVEKVIDSEGNETTFTYDGNGNMVSVTDPKGGETIITYDARNLPLTVTDAAGAKTTYDYNALGQLVKETDALGHSTSFAYNPAGQVTKVTNALGDITTFAYNHAGQVVKTVKPNGAVWSMEYDSRSLLTKIIDPFGEIKTLQRDVLGRVITSVDEAGEETHYSYNALGQVTGVENALGYATHFGYDERGMIEKVEDAKGQVTAYDYDELGRLIEVTNARNQSTVYRYDAAGNIAAKTDPKGRTTSYQYDLNGRLLQEINPLAEITTFAYDGNGNVTSMMQPDQMTTAYQYDLVNRLTKIQYDDGKTVDYTYNLLGLRTKMSDWNGSTSYSYDALNRLTEVTDTFGQTIQYGWTATGQRNEMTYPDGSTVHYEYDVMDRLQKVTDGFDRATTYRYDPRGFLTEKALPTGAVSMYSYDRIGQVTGITHQNQQGEKVEQLLYAYDPIGNRVRTERIEQEDEDKEAIITDYAYDGLNQLIEVQKQNKYDPSTLVTTAYRYDEVGNRLSKTSTWGDLSTLETYDYDQADKLLKWQSGTESKEYSYDPRGNLLEVTGLAEEAVATTEDVITVDESTVTEDAIVSDDVNPSADARQPEVLEQYTWSAANRLIKHTNPLGDITSYAYNGDGDRIQKTLDIKHGPDNRGNGQEQKNGQGKDNGNCHMTPPGFVPPGLAKQCGYGEEPFPDNQKGGPRDGWEKQYKKKYWAFNYTNDVSLDLPEPIQVTEADETNWKQTYVYGYPHERLSMTQRPSYDHDNGWEPSPGDTTEASNPPKTLWYLTDALGSTIGLLEKDGRLSAKYDYDEFGNPLDRKKFDINWPGPDNFFGYTGLEYDYNSDLTYARARYYKPEIGRFVSEDTYRGNLWNPQSQNLYGYVENNPVNYIDPSGNWCTSTDKKWVHPGKCNNSDSIYEPDNEHGGDWIVENGKKVTMFNNPLTENATAKDDKVANFIIDVAVSEGTGGAFNIVRSGAKNLVKGGIKNTKKLFKEYFSKGKGNPAHNAAQYQKLKEQLALEEIQSVVNTTNHGAKRLIERGFTPKDISDLKLRPDIIKTQSDGAQVFIKQVNGKYNVIVEGDNGVITSLKNISGKSLNRLSDNYGWR